MIITVNFLANISIFMERKQIKLELEDHQSYTMKDIIKKISETTGKDLINMVINEKGGSTRKVLINLNDKDISLKSKFETTITDGDKIDMAPLSLLG